MKIGRFKIGNLPLILGVFIALLAGQAWGATYYVDPTAADDNGAGTSPGTAWKTINKVNTTATAVGDVVYFKRGATWYLGDETATDLRLKRFVTYDAYGSGAKPIISGATAALTFTACDVGNCGAAYANTYYAAADWTVRIVVDNDTQLTQRANVAAINAATEGWYWATNVLYLKATGGADPATRTIEVGKRDNVVRALGVHGTNLLVSPWAYDNADNITCSGMTATARTAVGVTKYQTVARLVDAEGDGTCYKPFANVGTSQLTARNWIVPNTTYVVSFWAKNNGGSAAKAGFWINYTAGSPPGSGNGSWCSASTPCQIGAVGATIPAVPTSQPSGDFFALLDGTNWTKLYMTFKIPNGYGDEGAGNTYARLALLDVSGGAVDIFIDDIKLWDSVGTQTSTTSVSNIDFRVANAANGTFSGIIQIDSSSSIVFDGYSAKHSSDGGVMFYAAPPTGYWAGLWLASNDVTVKNGYVGYTKGWGIGGNWRDIGQFSHSFFDITNNEVAYATVCGIDTGTGSGKIGSFFHDIGYNHVHHTRLNVEGLGIETDQLSYGHLIHHNIVHDNAHVSLVNHSASGTRWYNNLSYNESYSFSIFGDLGNTADDTLVYNNTFNTTPAGIRIAGSTTNLKFKNNVIDGVATGAGNYDLQLVAGGTYTGLDCDYNLYGSNQLIYSDGTQYTLANWKTASSQDAHSKSGAANLNPLYKLKGTSPARTGAESIWTYAEWVAKAGDLFGKYPTGGTLSMGAAQFQKKLVDDLTDDMILKRSKSTDAGSYVQP